MKYNKKSSSTAPLQNKMQKVLWAGRFDGHIDPDMWNYTQSIHIDYKLLKCDVMGSIAHTYMLKECGHLNNANAKLIINALKEILKQIINNNFKINFKSEDIHSCIEHYLYTQIGDVAGKMHTGRSRNDQVALDLHLYIREHIYTLVNQLGVFVQTCITLAQVNIDVLMPGYTHMQRAEPIRFSHHILAYAAMFSRDIQRLIDVSKRVNISPLGAGAFSGSPIAIDNTICANILKFDGVYHNSIDAVSDRDFGIEFLSALSLIQMHFSKLSEEIILWTSQEFSFITLDDSLCTGSSMMPQKKNPDIAELARGKTGPVYGALLSLLTTLKGLPFSYNRDLQEDKKPIFEAFDTVSSTITMMNKLLSTCKLNTQHMLKEANSDYSNATEIANYLVAKNVPFREAHALSGALVRLGLQKNKLLAELDITDFKQVSQLIENDIYEVLKIINVIEKHTVQCGTSKKSVLLQIHNISNELKHTQKWLKNNAWCLCLELELFELNI